MGIFERDSEGLFLHYRKRKIVKYIAILDNRTESDPDFEFDCDVGERSWILLESENKEKALLELRNKFTSYFDTSDDELKKMSLLEVSHEIEIPLKAWYAEMKLQKNHEETARSLAEESERTEYERLKKKFEVKSSNPPG